MKFIDIPSLSVLSSQLSDPTGRDAKLNARVEVYSCKPVREDRKLKKVLERQLSGDGDRDGEAPGTPTASPLGDLTDAVTFKLLLNLISTLNSSFPDYDFASTKPEEFIRVPSTTTAVNDVTKQLAQCLKPSECATIINRLWGTVDEVIKLSDCNVYAYIPDLAADPFSLDTMWSFNYFFVNKVEKKILYFFCIAQAHSDSDSETDTDSEGDVAFFDERRAPRGRGGHSTRSFSGRGGPLTSSSPAAAGAGTGASSSTVRRGSHMEPGLLSRRSWLSHEATLDDFEPDVDASSDSDY